VLAVEGSLVIRGGTFEVVSGSEASSVASLVLEGGTLTGAATVDVTGSLTWEHGASMAGAGKTVLRTGASGSVLPTEPGSGCGEALLTGRTFVNEGTIVSGSGIGVGALLLSEGARLENVGTFKGRGEPVL